MINETFGNAEIFNGNGLGFLRTLPDGGVDHIITDPPYSKKTHEGARTHGRTNSQRGRELVTFDCIDDVTFLAICAEAVRVARRWVILTCDLHHFALLPHSDLPLIRLGIWVKPNGAPQFTGDRPGMGYETVAILHNPRQSCRWNGGGKHAVWNYPIVTDALVPTQKPLPLLQRWIAEFTDVGETILDPFMGSATTGIAAVSMDRRFVGVEIDNARYQVAARRLHEWDQQLKLPFPIAEEKPTKEALFTLPGRKP